MHINTEQAINFINRVTKNGVPISINDEVAIKSIIVTGMITAIGTFIATYYATRATSKNTIELFKKQEKMRIKEDLRIDFYKKYKQKYDDVYDGVVKIHQSIVDKKQYRNREELYIKENYYDSIENKTIWSYSFPKAMYEKDILRIRETCNNLDSLKKFIKANNIIYKVEKCPYCDIYIKLDEIKGLYNTLHRAYMNLDIKGSINIENIKVAAVKEHNEAVTKLFEAEIILEKIISDIETINKTIENEFIGEYFK